MPQPQPSPRQQMIDEARAIAAALLGRVEQIVAMSGNAGLGEAKRVERARLAVADAMIAVMRLRD